MAHVFLDLDGTLIDPKPGITASAQHALRSVGMVAPEADALTWMIGPALIDSFARLGAPDPQRALAHYRERYGRVGLYEAELYEGTLEMLGAMRAAGHQLVLMTAKPHVFARQVTAHFGIADLLAHQFGPELDGTRNDKGELLRFALDQIGVQAEASVMIGDRHHDIDAAQANGMASVAVTWGYGAPGEWAGATQICRDRRDLPGAIEAILAR
jgi:phosphoglycolate phosphatase